MVLWWIGLLILLAQAAVSILLIISVIRLNILETWITSLVIGALILLFILCGVPLLFRKRPMWALRIICVLVSVLCIGGGAFALRYTESFNTFFDKISLSPAAIVDEGADEPKDKVLDVTKDPFVVYISGSDSHTSVDDPTARSDVNIVVVVNPAKGKILLASIPRDTYVQLHGTTGLMDKLTHAGLEMYGSDMSKNTIQDYLGITIDHTIKVSFDTVVSVVDQLDGIEIYSDKALTLGASMKDGSKKRCNFIVGTQFVDGACALSFARERKSYSTGDKHRGENQQEVLAGLINKFISSRDYILRLPEILEIASDSFITDFSRDDITNFIRFQLAEQVKWQIDTANLDGVGDLLPTYTYPDQNLWVMLADEESLQFVKDKIHEYLGDK